MRGGNGGAQRFVGDDRGAHQFGRRHGELFRSHDGLVEAFGEFDQRRVAARTDGFDDAAGALVDDGVKQARRRRADGELFREIGVAVTERAHDAAA